MKSLNRLLILFLIPVLLLCSCRSSPVLEEVVYTQKADELDEEQEMLDPEDEGEETEDFQNIELEDIETERDTSPEDGIEDDTGDADSAVDAELNINSLDNRETGETSDQTSQSDNEGTVETTTEEGTEASEAALTEESDLTGGDEGTVPTAGNDAVTYKQVVDASGNTVELPENVETVTAVGAAAQMVEMLGGSGRLIGTNSDLLSSPLAQAAFPDYSSIQSWWSGDGSTEITESNFAALIEAHPDACFEISGQDTFTNNQVQQLSEAGIAYVILPALTSEDNLETAVSIVAQVLGTSSDGTECSEIASSYNSWVESTISTVGSKTSDVDLTSLYIVSWDYEATYILTDTPSSIESSGSGLAVAYSPAKSQLISTFMSAAGVTNESTRTNTHKASNYLYVTPLFHQFAPSVSGTKASYYSGGGEYAIAYDLFVSRLYSSVYYQLGSSIFPAIIVADESIKEEIENNWFWQYYESSGYIYFDDGSKIYRAIAGEYDIYVNPSGMIDWAEGSLESPLEAYWVACKFSGAYTIEEVKAQTSYFYETFFGVSLTESQLEEIFGE